MAEAVNGLFKTELIRRQGPWKTVKHVELATMEWVYWWNHHRLHSELGYRTPMDIENQHQSSQQHPELATATLGKH